MKQTSAKQNTISCRVRTHSNFLGVVNRATVRMGLKNHQVNLNGHLVGESQVRPTCLDSGSLEHQTEDHFQNIDKTKK